LLRQLSEELLPVTVVRNTMRMKRIDTLLLGPETWTFASESGGATLAP
jgi:hypothetical protein